MNKITYIILALIAVIFTILASRLIPGKYFEPYNIEMDSTWRKDATDQEYIVDINNDSVPESFLHHKINQSGHSIEFRHGKMLHEIYIFDKNEIFISRFLKFADINHDNAKGIIFITARGRIAYLNILEYNFKKQLLLPVDKIKIDTFSYFNNVPDIINNNLITYHSEIYFDLQAGYSIQPRNIYKYDFNTKKLVKTKRSSIVTTKFEHINYNGEELLLATKVTAAGNTVSPKESEELRQSKDPDTLKMYEETKNNIYQYGDFSSYILLYNNNLEFAFEPVEFNGWTNCTRSGFIWIDSIPYITAITTNKLKNNKLNEITLCNLKGNILKQTPVSFKYENIFIDYNQLVYQCKNRLHLYSGNQTLINKIGNITTAAGFFDINNDKQKEFIALKNNELIIFTRNFRHKTTFKIEQEFSPFPEENRIETIQMNGKTCFFYNSRLFYYIFRYEANQFAILKYPFYALMFFSWFGILFLIVRLNTKRLEKEKQRLEGIVAERTLELKTKNKQLAQQKNEIEVQAEELRVKNHNLEELDKFKRTLISTLVHDLKNPLGQIMLSTSDKRQKHMAGKMLRLILNLLDVEKYEQTTFSLDKQQVSLRPLLDEVIANQEISLNEKNLTMITKSDDLEVMADREILARVFENLLTNAIRFSPLNDTIEITARGESNGTVRVTVENQGIPIPEESLETIFNKYVQGYRSGQSGYQSTGLGLTFCRMAVQAHGHTIKARNTATGVAFEFTLDGSKTSGYRHQTIARFHSVQLTGSEEAIVHPWLNQLKDIEVYKITEIIRIVRQIPDYSEGVKAFKQQLLDVAFASNSKLFAELTGKKAEGDGC